jgi:hypothetical protein
MERPAVAADKPVLVGPVGAGFEIPGHEPWRTGAGAGAVSMLPGGDIYATF